MEPAVGGQMVCIFFLPRQGVPGANPLYVALIWLAMIPAAARSGHALQGYPGAVAATSSSAAGVVEAAA
jgi:hypothetical protein